MKVQTLSKKASHLSKAIELKQLIKDFYLMIKSGFIAVILHHSKLEKNLFLFSGVSICTFHSWFHSHYSLFFNCTNIRTLCPTSLAIKSLFIVHFRDSFIHHNDLHYGSLTQNQVITIIHALYVSCCKQSMFGWSPSVKSLNLGLALQLSGHHRGRYGSQLAFLHALIEQGWAEARAPSHQTASPQGTKKLKKKRQQQQQLRSGGGCRHTLIPGICSTPAGLFLHASPYFPLSDLPHPKPRAPLLSERHSTENHVWWCHWHWAVLLLCCAWSWETWHVWFFRRFTTVPNPEQRCWMQTTGR